MKDGEHVVVTSGGLGFMSVLQIVFIVLKLCGVISWHWALVMLPLIISVGLSILFWVVLGIIYGIMCLFEHFNRKK